MKVHGTSYLPCTKIQEESTSTENGQEESDEILFDEGENFDESGAEDSDEVTIIEDSDGSDEIQIAADEEEFVLSKVQARTVTETVLFAMANGRTQ